LIEKLFITLEMLLDVIAVHFQKNKHPCLNIVKHCELFYIHKYVILTGLKNNHSIYKCVCIESNLVYRLHENYILNIIIRSI
jgi:hypothetical protein